MTIWQEKFIQYVVTLFMAICVGATFCDAQSLLLIDDRANFVINDRLTKHREKANEYKTERFQPKNCL